MGTLRFKSDGVLEPTTELLLESLLLPVNGSTNFTNLNDTISDEYDYDYDFETALTTYDYAEIIPTAIVYNVTLIAGLIGNSLIIYSVSHFRRMRSASNVFLASLAFADLLLIIFCVPVKLAQLLSYTWDFGELCCKMVHYMQNLSAICSVLTLTTMSVERYYAIIHPVRSRYLCTMSQTKKIICLIWILAIIAASPVMFVQIHMQVGTKRKAYWCVRDWNNPIQWRIYECYMLCIILVIPSVVMGYAYARICYKLKDVVIQRAAMFGGQETNEEPRNSNFELNSISEGDSLTKPRTVTNGCRQLHQMRRQRVGEDSQTVKQVIHMLIAVVVLFVVCWSPILILNLLSSFEIIEALNYGFLKPFRITANLLSYLNSCVNPIVYGFMSHSFRASFMTAVSNCFCWRRKPRARNGSVTTRTSTFCTRTTTIKR